MHTRDIQTRLNALGFPCEIDGWPGPKTQAAIKAFQASRGLKADGIVGPVTEGALWGASQAPTTLFTRARIKRIFPKARNDIIQAFDTLAVEIAAAGLTTPLRAAHFMTQVGPETGGLTKLEENLSYSAERLCQVWPKRFPTLVSAHPYAHNPEGLANKVYGGHLGNMHAGDGWRYRGSGLLQTTGRDNFRAAGHENNPEGLRTPIGGLKAALKFWSDHGCNALADKDDCKGLRHVINGGENGLAEAQHLLPLAKAAFYGTTPAPAFADIPPPPDIQLRLAREEPYNEPMPGQPGYVPSAKPSGVHPAIVTCGAIGFGALVAWLGRMGGLW